MIQIYNQDCMTAMETMPNNAFDLAIVDPPYGIHDSLITTDKGLNQSNKFALKYMEKNWDTRRPDKKYFIELQRVSRHQIIWGGNYFADLLPPSRAWICWDKKQDNFTCVNNELAWTSFNKALNMFRRDHGLDNGFMIKRAVDERIHPTQKPVALYKWLLSKYAKKGWVILDTHLGSGSSAIAAHDMAFNFVGYELDKDYYQDALKRLHRHQRQLRLFVD